VPRVIKRAQVVIVGGGFGGLYAARALAGTEVDVTVVDRSNHHVFQPLLYQVATASLAPSDITAPIRWILRRSANIAVRLAEVKTIDVAERRIHLSGPAASIVYDYLILAPGSRHSYFGRDEWEQFAPGLKSVEDGIEIRRRFLTAFERAEATEDAAERDANMTFVVVGGGPTGVELSGAIPLIAHRALGPDFRKIDTRKTRVILLEGGSRVLSTFPESISAVAARDLSELGVEVRVNSTVTGVSADGVMVGAEFIPAKTVFWAAGNLPSPLGRQLGCPLHKGGRVIVEPDLTIPGHSEVFVVGDLAFFMQDGKAIPAVSPAAMQQGASASRNILRDVRRQERVPFRYRNKGELATIGRSRAVADLPFGQLSGRLAWWFWLLLHIFYLIGFRNRLSVMVQWGYSYFTYQRGVRLITERR
jgi:NADH:ubiquinone reductase (H+-translocating)